MEQFARIKESVVAYFSPKRTETTMSDSKRRRTIGPESPSKAVVEEHAYQPISEPRGERAQVALYHRLSTKYASSPVSKNPLKRSREDEDEDVPPDRAKEDVGMNLDCPDEEGDSISPEDSPSQIAANHDEIEDDEEGEQGDYEEDELEEDGEEGEQGDYEEDELEQPVDEEALAREKVEEYLARQAELALKQEAIAQVKQQGDWHPDEVYLFERLSLRSFEALVPREWQIDFRTLPEELFGEDKEKVLINYNYSSSGYGVKALQTLLSLGIRVKDLLDNIKRTQYIVKALKNYIKWSEKDGGYLKKRFFPILTIVTGKSNQTTERISKAITDQMQLLAKQHRDHLVLTEPRINEIGEVELYRRQPPLLYGIIVAQSIAIFVTLDSSNPEAKIRHIAHFDFKEAKMAVWNGLALAIICVVARNYLMSIKDEFEDDDEPITDVDA